MLPGAPRPALTAATRSLIPAGALVGAPAAKGGVRARGAPRVEAPGQDDTAEVRLGGTAVFVVGPHRGARVLTRRISAGASIH